MTTQAYHDTIHMADNGTNCALNTDGTLKDASEGEMKVRTVVSEVPREHAGGMGDSHIETHELREPGGLHNEVEGVRVEQVETVVSKVSRVIQEGLGDGSDEERQPTRPDEAPDKAQVELRDPREVQVKPGGEVGAKQNRSAMHKDAGTMVDDKVEGMHRDAQVDRESAGTR